MRSGRRAAEGDPAWMTGSVLLDAAGRRRSPATMPGFHCGRPPRNKGRSYPADPPTVEEIVAVMRCAGNCTAGLRTRALIVLLWRAGLRVSEALALSESDLDPGRASILVRRGKGGRRRQVGMDAWGWEHLHRWLEVHMDLPIGALLLRRGRSDGWTTLVVDSRTGHAAPPRPGRGHPPSLRTASTPARARGRDGPRGRPAGHHSAPARAPEPRHHQHLPRGNRQQRDHQHRPPGSRRPCCRPAPDSANRSSNSQPQTCARGRAAHA